jgi:hypothetical protein
VKGVYSLASSSFHILLSSPSIPPSRPPNRAICACIFHCAAVSLVTDCVPVPQHVGIAATSQPGPEWLSAGCHAHRGTHAFSCRRALQTFAHFRRSVAPSTGVVGLNCAISCISGVQDEKQYAKICVLFLGAPLEFQIFATWLLGTFSR